LTNIGAKHVIAIDYKIASDYEQGRLPSKKITTVSSYFQNYTEEIDIAFASWPTNGGAAGFIELVARARILIYLGKNTEGTICAEPGFFEHTCRRKLLAYVPWRHNTLIVVGEKLKRKRAATREEKAGMHVHGIWDWKEEPARHVDETIGLQAW